MTDAKCPHCAAPFRLGSDLEAAHDKIAEQQAIIDKLPKTADGVPVVPGMALYYTTAGGGIIESPAILDWEEIHDEVGDNMHSTPEAAQLKEQADD